MKYYRELWNQGPVRAEARRIAKEMLVKKYRDGGKDFNLLSTKGQDNAVTVLLFNSEDVILKRAKFNLEARG